MEKIFDIEVDCAQCAAKCEDAVNKIDGVNCSINFMTQKMRIEADNVDDVLKKVVKACKKIEPDFLLKD